MVLRAFLSRLPRGLLPWGALCLFFGLGMLVSFVQVVSTPSTERAQAMAHHQRVSVDIKTGAITGLPKKEASSEEEKETSSDKADAHDKAPEEEVHEAAPAHDTDAPAQPKAADAAAKPAETAADEHKAPEAAKPAAAPQEAKPETAATAAAPNTSGLPALATHQASGEIPKIAVTGESTVAPGALEITETVGGQSLPKRGEKDLAAGTLYAKNFTPNPELTQVSIVLVDAGMNSANVAAILKLPKQVGVAFSPYAPDIQAAIAGLHAAGFETWGMLPTMSAQYPKSDPGPMGLIASLPPEENQRRLRAVMSNTLGAAGLVLLSDESLSLHARAFAPVLEEIANRGLWLLSTHPTRTVDVLTGSDKTLRPSIRRADIVLDASVTPSEMQSKLDGIKAMILAKKTIIVVVPARLPLIEILGDWLSHGGLTAKAELAPLSAAFRPPRPAAPPAEEKPHGGSTEGAEEAAKPAAEEKKSEHGAAEQTEQPAKHDEKH